MHDLVAPDFALGVLLLGLAMLYAAWHETRKNNRPDAQLLAALGACSLLGGAVWLA